MAKRGIELEDITQGLGALLQMSIMVIGAGALLYGVFSWVVR